MGHIAIIIVLFYEIGTIISRFYPQSLFTYNPMTYVLGNLFLSAFSVPFFFLSVGDLFFSKSFFFEQNISGIAPEREQFGSNVRLDVLPGLIRTRPIVFTSIQGWRASEYFDISSENLLFSPKCQYFCDAGQVHILR